MRPRSAVPPDILSARQRSEADLLGYGVVGSICTDRQWNSGFRGNGASFLDTSASNQPRGRLGQFEPGEWEQEHQWQGADEEQSAPSDGITENDRQDGSHDATGRDTAVDDGVEQIAASRRRELGNHGSAVATNPPTPMPVKNRSRPKVVMLVANAASAIPTENQMMLTSIIFRRPK